MTATGTDTAPDPLRTGEVVADRVFREFEPALRRAVRRRLPGRVRHRFDSTDVVQSAWVSILPGLRDGRWQFRDNDHLRAFLMRVVLFRLYDRAGTALTQLRHERPITGPGPGGGARPSEYAVADEIWHRLLAACPPEHRAVLHARRAGASCEEIAERSGMHPGSVRRILRLLARRIAFDDPSPVPAPPGGP